MFEMKNCFANPFFFFYEEEIFQSGIQTQMFSKTSKDDFDRMKLPRNFKNLR